MKAKLKLLHQKIGCLEEKVKLLVDWQKESIVSALAARDKTFTSLLIVCGIAVTIIGIILVFVKK